MPKIPEFSVGIHMERFVLVSSDRNIRDHLWRWSTYFGRNIPKFAIPFLKNRFFALIREFGERIFKNDKNHFHWLARFNHKMLFPLISDRSVWYNRKHPYFLPVDPYC